MGTFYNSRPLEWFECGRTELLRAAGLAYAEMERRGVLLPVVESHVEYLGRARYDDLLRMTSRGALVGKARLRVDYQIVQADGGAGVARGYTVHAITNSTGKPMRPPEWLARLFGGAAPAAAETTNNPT
jgi:acyl-CoA thioester hydrolase